ncbi:hypothetical protein NQ314_018115 [Rhamnusium bicolor]|uniref:NADH dehydrogenase subunit 6 n=1 Tax=Rhamnusium bicolor TaxID=1586634 RepID=A0AAV8WS27_9CUCU|nr:hypothetical protein NQ314_018115 [Rhamnusium bicolor]
MYVFDIILMEMALTGKSIESLCLMQIISVIKCFPEFLVPTLIIVGLFLINSGVLYFIIRARKSKNIL